MLLVGDVGGTKTILAHYEKSTEGLVRVRERIFPSADYDSLEAVILAFLEHRGLVVEAACFGVAGPVFDGVSRITNLPWVIDERHLSDSLGISRVRILNDLQAMALGLLRLGPEEWLDLNPGADTRAGNRAVIAAGTGLGEAILYWDGLHYHPIATEGGHSDFAAPDAFADGLVRSLRGQGMAHVSVERLLSGAGIWTLYQYLRDSGSYAESEALAAAINAGEDPAPLISFHAIQYKDPLARETLRCFARLYGAEAGNLALKCLSVGGVLIGGGIAPKILNALVEDDQFMEGFLAKGRFAGFLKNIPVRVALNPQTALLGAADFASRNLV